MKILLALVLATVLCGCANVHRSDLKIADSATENCVRTEVISLPKAYPAPDFYDREEVANIYLPYAIAALNSYAYRSQDGTVYEATGEFSNFTLKQYDARWKKQARVLKPSGLALDYYFDESDPEIFKVLVAFRGTEFESISDWYSNLSWFTQLLPLRNQYDVAREVFGEIRSKAKEKQGAKKATFITTGHSLGGGLAEHIAHAFPCTSAVVFDSSFVVNRYRLAQPYDDAQVVHIFDKDDELTFVRRLFSPDAETPTYRRFRLNAVARGSLQHGSERLVVGMARTVATCQAREGSTGCPRSDQRAKQVYCNSRYARLEQNEPHCAKR
jgi:hypothetical protein